MMFPSLGLLLSALLLHIASGECPGERPTKNLLCYVREIPEKFDSCLCTHLILQTPLEKLTPQSDVVKEAKRLQQTNPALKLVLQAAESAEVALKKRGGYAQSVATAVSKLGLDGVEVDLKWGKQLAGKVQLVDFVQTLSKELEKLEPKERSKRDYKIYEKIDGDTVTPKWTLQANKKFVRRTRDVESTEEAETTTTVEETTTIGQEEGEKTEEAVTSQEIEEEGEEYEEEEDGKKQIILHLTSEPQYLAKNFDLKRLSKYVSLYTLASENLTDSSEAGLAYHPSRLMGIEDILNADSLVDLVTGLGAPHEKLVLSLPATALKFTLADKAKNMPQSPVTGQPSTLTRAELCKTMTEGEWTVERDEDLTAPYAYHDTTWLAFDDPTSVSIKGKYILLRDLAGAAVRDADAEDWLSKCNSSGPVLINTLHDTFTNIARRSRAAQLVSLQEQLHEAGQFQYSGDVHLSPYRIVRVVDRAGSIHVVRKEAKTEFECSRQGYFRHPSGCNRFYRCVKFNQYTPDFTVFEYDCPAGLAFDETVEVCVWPGSLADGGACQGSSEIAPVPRSRYVCPQVAGYYADPENCRWFFACLDHQGDGSPLTAYEFRCPFGLVFDEQALVCNWPWLVPGCGGAGVYQARFTVGDFYEGRHRPSYASLSDVHVSGGRIENVPGGVVLDSSISGIGSGAYLGSYAAGSNALGAGVYAGAAGYNGLSGASGAGNGAYLTSGASGAGGSGAYAAVPSGSGTGYVATGGLGQAAGVYSSGAGIGSGAYSAGNSGAYAAGGAGSAYLGANAGAYKSVSSGAGYVAGGIGSASGVYGSGAYSGAGVSSSTRYGGANSGAGAYVSGANYAEDNSGAYVEDNSGAYIHDPTGDTGGLYSGKASYGGAYIAGAYDTGAYKHEGSSGGQYKGGYPAAIPYSGSYDTGSYKGGYDAGSYKGDYDAGSYKGEYDAGSYSGKYDAGAYSGKYDGGAYSGKYDGGAYSGKYDGGAYSGKYDGGAYSGKYDGGAYSGKYDGGAYSGKYDGGAYSGKYDGGAYSGSSSGAYQGEGAYSGSGGAYGSHEYNSVNVVEHKPVVGLVGLDAVKVTGGDTQSGSYVSSYVTPAVTPVVSHYSSVTPAPIAVSTYTASTLQPTTPRPTTYYPVSSTVAPISSKPLISYSTVKPPLVVESYQQPSYVKTVTPAPVYSYSTPSVGVVKPVVPVNTYTYQQPVVKSEFVSGVQYSTPAPVAYEQPSYVKTVTPAPYVETASVGYAYQKPLGPAYLPPVSNYGYKSSVVQPVDLKFSYPKPAVLKTPIVPLNPIQYSTPAPVIYSAPVKPISLSTPAPIVPVASYTPTVLKTPIVPLNPVQYTTPAPINFGYSTPSPVKTYTYSSTYSTPAPPVSYQPSVPVQPLRPISYSTPAPAVYQYSTPKPLQPRPITYSTPAPFSVEYNVPTVLKTPVVPLNPVQYAAPVPVQPVSYLKPITYSTPAPAIYQGPKYLPPEPVQPLKPIVYSTPAPAVVTYQAPVKPVVPLVAKTPVIPLNPIQYTTPAPPRIDLSYTPVQPVGYVKPVAPVVSYQSTPAPLPVRPVVYSTPAPPVVQKEYIQPVAPVVPVVRNQYLPPAPVAPIAPVVSYQSTPAPPVISYHSTPAPPPARPVVYSTPAPPVVPVIQKEYIQPVAPVVPVVRNQYLPPAPVTPVAPLPAIRHEYVAPVAPTVLKTPIVPLNPIQYTTPAPVVYHQPTPAPIVPLRPVSYSTPAPPSYEYLPPARVEPVRPVVYSTPAPPVVREYLPPAPVPVRPLTYSTPAPAVVNYEYSAPAPLPVKPVLPITYSTPAPAVSYVQPAQPVRPVRPISLSTPAPFSYQYQPVKSIPTVLKTPVVPLNPVQYTTAAPAVVQYSTPAPIQTVSYVKPVRPVTYTTPAPIVSYEHSTVAPATYIKPVPTVLKTPVVPLNPVQYTTSAPVINQFRFGVAYQNPEIQYQPEVYQPAVIKSQVVQEGYGYARPAVKLVDTPKFVSTTPAPAVVTYSHVTPEPTPIYKQVYNYMKTPIVSAYDKVLNAISYSTTPAPLPVQPVTTSSVSYAPVNVGQSYSRPALVKTQSIPVTPVAVVPEYQKVLNVVKATTTASPLYVNHYQPEIVPVSTPRPVVYKQKPIVVPETYVKDYSYEENLDEVYDHIKSDFGTRLTGYEQGYAYNQQKVVVPQVVYTSTTPAPLPVLKEVTYKVRKPVKTYVQTYEQPAVAVGYEGSYQGGSVYSSTPAPVVVTGSSEAAYGDQYHKEVIYKGYTGRPDDNVPVTPCDHASHSPIIVSTTPLPALPTIRLTTTKVARPEGGYYVRKQKVRVRPVVTTENYPQLYTSTYVPSTVSTTTYRPTYSTTAVPKVTVSTTVHPEDVVDIEGEEEEEEEEIKLLQGYDGKYGGIVEKGGYSVSSTVASIEDGEAVVGVLKKGRITYDGRRTKSKVVVVSKLSDFNPLLVRKMGAECSCDGKSNSLQVTQRRTKQRGSSRLFTPSRDSTVPDQQYVDTYLTSSTTLAPIVVNSYDSPDTPVVEIRPLRKKTRVYSTTTAEPVYDEEPGLNIVSSGNDRVKADSVECKRAGLFRHPNRCNKFYSCNWDQWKKKFTLHEFKCPIHLAYDINLGACNWPSKGPACAEDSLLV